MLDLMEKPNRNVEILKQVLRSVTSIGANIAESQYAQSRPDFLTKLTVALKEANETRFLDKTVFIPVGIFLIRNSILLSVIMKR